MTKAQFMVLMQFPSAWETLRMYPEELFQWQVSNYEVGHEEGSEHDRNGAFHWWLRRGPSRKQIEKLLRLSFFDPDPALGADVRMYIRQMQGFDSELSLLERQLLSEQQKNSSKT